MKKLFTILALIFSTHLFSQSYIFTQSSGTFSSLSGSTSTINAQKIPIGFTFNFFNQNYDSLYVRDGGYIFFNDIFSPKSVISAFDAPDANPIPGSMSYQLSGTTGSRVFKLEWKDVILNNNSAEYISYQMWLYEGTNCVDIFIGPNGSMPSSSYGGVDPGANIGIGLPESNQYYSLTGSPSSPNFILNNDTSLTGTPSNGTIYKFCALSNGIFDYSSNSLINISPNPSSGFFKLESSEINFEFVVTNILGEIILKSKIQNEKLEIDLDNKPEGIYFIRATANNRTIHNEKIIIVK